MGKLNFRGYLISRFYPTRENLMHTKNMFYSRVLTLVVRHHKSSQVCKKAGQPFLET